MNATNAHLYLPLVQALAEGKTLQFLTPVRQIWEDTTDVDFAWLPESYRIKPQPREWNLWVSDNDTIAGQHSDMSDYPSWKQITVREVIE